MELGLKNKVILITGAAKGIGKGIALCLADEGAIPIIIGRNASDNKLVVEEIQSKGGVVFAVEAELTEPDDCLHAVNKVIEKFKRIDGLVNNAGSNDGVGLEHGNYDDFLSSLHKNLIHYYLMAQYCLPELIKSRGVIVNISSKTGEVGQGNTSAYAASNGGRNALTREWAVELAKYSIRVNAVVVSECWTPQYEKWISTVADSEDELKRIRDKIPLENRMTRIEEIADTTVFLLSERSGHTTGQLVHVDGGYVHLDRAIPPLGE